MKLSKEEVSQLALLARLKLSPKEIEKYRKQLSDVLNYVAKVQKFVGKSTQKTSFKTLERENVLREDKIISCPISPQELLANAPEVKDGFVKVPGILEEQ